MLSFDVTGVGYWCYWWRSGYLLILWRIFGFSMPSGWMRAICGQVSCEVAMPASAYLSFLHHTECYRRLSRSRLGSKIRWNVAVLVEAEAHIPYASGNSSACRGAYKTVSYASVSRAKYGNLGEDILIWQPDWRVFYF